MCIGRCATQAGVMFNASDCAVSLHGLQIGTGKPDHLLGRIAKGSCQHLVCRLLLEKKKNTTSSTPLGASRTTVTATSGSTAHTTTFLLTAVASTPPTAGVLAPDP